MSSVADLLRKNADLFDQRHAVYGDNYKKVGAVFAALFPDGVMCKTPHDWNRMHILMLNVVKLTRYTENWHRGGHADSLADQSVYAAMLHEIDAKQEELNPGGPIPLDLSVGDTLKFRLESDAPGVIRYGRITDFNKGSGVPYQVDEKYYPFYDNILDYTREEQSHGA